MRVRKKFKHTVKSDELKKVTKKVQGILLANGNYACPKCLNQNGEIIDYGLNDIGFRFIRYCDKCLIAYYYVKTEI